jgi:cysteine desulfurase/selenocysteine lyase
LKKEEFTFIPKNGKFVAADMRNIKSDFPLLAERPDLVYLDSASTTQKPKEVIDALGAFYTHSNANVHRSVYGLAEKATAAFEGSRGRMAAFIRASSSREIVFTRGTTDGLNIAAVSATRAFLKEGDEILLTLMEHHSNIVPWQIAAEQRGYKLSFLPLTGDGELDLDALARSWTSRTRLVSLTHASNVLGTVNPVREVADFAHRRGALVVVDAAQSAGHMTVDIRELGCDFLAFSGHKMYGPLGIGILWAREDLLERMPPYQGGGEMIMTVTTEKSTYNEIPYKFEAGTPNIEGAVGLAAAADYLDGLGRQNVEVYETELAEYAFGKLSAVPGLILYGRAGRRAPVLTFNLDGIHSHDLAQFLDRDGVAVRSGHHCAQPLLKELGAKSAARASLGVYTVREDIDRLTGALEKAREFFRP